MIVIAYKPGQLANRLFLFAKFLAYSYKQEVLVINPSFDDYACYFEKTKNQFIPASRGWKGPSLKAVIKLFYKACFIIGRILHRWNLKFRFITVTYLDWSEHYNLDVDQRLHSKGVHFIQGWEFDASDLIKLHKSEIIQFFQPERGLKNAIDNFFQQIDHSKLLIGVHIRHGDYQFFEGGKYFFKLKEYEVVMKSLKERHSDCIFLVCSNNREISKNSFHELNIIMAPGHELLDLYLLAKCNYIMGPPSTYSLWASFFGSVPLYQIIDIHHSVDLTDFKLER
jgi:hypothetical protein